MKEKNKLWTQSATAVCQKKDHTCILVHTLVTPKDTLNQNMSTQREKREVSLPSRQLKGSDVTQGIEKTMFELRSDWPLNIQSMEVWSSWNIFKKLIWRFYAGVHSYRQESIWSSGKYIFPILSNFVKLVKPS